jgi:lysophospholipase L1-like esterase
MPRFIFLAVVALLSSAHAAAQDSTGFERWEKDIQKFEQQITDGKAKHEGLLFIGSSSIRMWNLEKWFPGRQAVNFGFGGSEVADSLHFFDRIVTPLKPKTIAMYAGDNDIAKGKTAERVFADFQSFAARVKDELPQETRLLYIAIKPSIKRWELREEMAKANSMIAAACAKDERLEYVDIWTPMIGADGKPRPELFAKDGLHLNETGYELWTSLISAKLIR